MDRLIKINEVLDYIEENLTEPINYEQMAQLVYCSVHEFSRIFSFVAGISLSEYIRRRRLTEAGFDIQSSNEKITDIAMKYCYDAPAAFTRAFRDLHGVSPQSARTNGANLKKYYPIKFLLSRTGAIEMINFNSKKFQEMFEEKFCEVRAKSTPPSVSTFEVFNTSATTVNEARGGKNLAWQEGVKPIAINSVMNWHVRLINENLDPTDDKNRWAAHQDFGFLDDAEPDWINTKNIWFGVDLGEVTEINSIIVTESDSVGTGSGKSVTMAGFEHIHDIDLKKDVRRTIGDWVVEIATDATLEPNDNCSLSAEGWTVVASGSCIGQGQTKLISFAATKAKFVRMRTLSTIKAKDE